MILSRHTSCTYKPNKTAVRPPWSTYQSHRASYHQPESGHQKYPQCHHQSQQHIQPLPSEVTSCNGQIWAETHKTDRDRCRKQQYWLSHSNVALQCIAISLAVFIGPSVCVLVDAQLYKDSSSRSARFPVQFSFSFDSVQFSSAIDKIWHEMLKWLFCIESI